MKSLNLRANGRLEQEMPRNMRFRFLDNSTNSEQGINLMSRESSEDISESSEARQGMGSWASRGRNCQHLTDWPLAVLTYGTRRWIMLRSKPSAQPFPIRGVSLATPRIRRAMEIQSFWTGSCKSVLILAWSPATPLWFCGWLLDGSEWVLSMRV